MPSAGASHPDGIARRWIHVVIHRNDHRDEHDGVVEQVQLDAREPDLSDARRDLAAKPEVMGVGLVEQNEMLEVVPELNNERRHPPLEGSTGESAAQNQE